MMENSPLTLAEASTFKCAGNVFQCAVLVTVIPIPPFFTAFSLLNMGSLKYGLFYMRLPNMINRIA